jgi:hypothetical protein
VVVQDWLIVAVGDSYGSGEGNPDLPIPPQAITDLEEALAELKSKQGALADAVENLADVQVDYDKTIAAGKNVRAKLAAHEAAVDHEKEVCTALPPKPVQCAEAKVDTATALGNLSTALAAMGLQGLIDSLPAIPQEVARLEDLARASLDAAKAGVSAAQAAVDAAVEKVTRAEERAVPTWQDCPCHRSANSGQAQAALAVERADPRTSVTFLHLSCSGATILKGLRGDYEGIEPDCADQHDNRPQIDQVRDLVGEREIDALLTSIGGNDAYFSKIVEACMVEESCDVSARKDGCLAATHSVTCDRAGPFAKRCSDYFSSRDSTVPSGTDIFQAGLNGLSPAECAEQFCSVVPAEELLEPGGEVRAPRHVPRRPASRSRGGPRLPRRLSGPDQER